MMATIVVPGETKDERRQREARWECDKCGCIFEPTPDDVRESMGFDLPSGGGRMPIEWYARCPNPDCHNTVKSKRRAIFAEWGPRFTAPVSFVTIAPQELPWYRSEGARIVAGIVGLSFGVLVAILILVVIMERAI
jgi:hypothetical protein